MTDPVYKYGSLNDIKPPQGKEVSYTSENSVDQIRATVQESYESKVGLDGEFTGIILSILDNDTPTFTDRLRNLFNSGKGVETKKYRVRVPEIHSLIPEPTSQTDYYSINLHDVFEVQISNAQELNLKVNDLVVVSLKDGIGRDSYKIIRKDARIAQGFGVGDGPAQASNSATSPQVAAGPNYAPNVNKPVPPSPQNMKDHTGRTIVTLSPSSYRENRVALNEAFGPLPSSSPLLVKIPSRSGNVKLHSLVAERFMKMREAAAQEGIDIYGESGHKNRKFANYNEYSEFITRTYVNNTSARFYWENFLIDNNDPAKKSPKDGYKLTTSVEEARNLSYKAGKSVKAYMSAHETGMAIDLFIPPVKEGEIAITSNKGVTNKELQQKTTAWKWLRSNAHKFGFSPLKSEPWHWECLLPIESWKTGSEFASNYAVFVREEATKSGMITSSKSFKF